MENLTPPRFPASPPPLPPTHLDQPSPLRASPPLPKNNSLTLAHFHRLTETQEEEILSNGNKWLFAVKVKLRVNAHHEKVRSVNCSGLDSVRLGGLATPDPSTKVKVLECCFCCTITSLMGPSSSSLTLTCFAWCSRSLPGDIWSICWWPNTIFQNQNYQVLQISLYPTHNGRAHHTDAFSIVAEKQVASETSVVSRVETGIWPKNVIQGVFIF